MVIRVTHVYRRIGGNWRLTQRCPPVSRPVGRGSGLGGVSGGASRLWPAAEPAWSLVVADNGVVAAGGRPLRTVRRRYRGV